MVVEQGGKGKAVYSSAVNQLALKILLSITLVLCIAGATLLYLEQREDREGAIVRARLISEGLANRFSSGISFYSQTLGRYLSSHPQLAGAVKKESWPTLQKYEKQLARLLPKAQKVRIVPMEWDELQPDSTPPVSYATLEMLRSVERSKKPSVAEVHQFGREHPHIALAAPIVDYRTGDLAGVAQLLLPMSLLDDEFASLGKLTGRIELQQVLDNDAVVLTSTGGVASISIHDGEVPVKGTLWRLSYWGETEESGLAAYWDIWGVLALVLLLSAMAVIFLSHIFKKKLERDRRLIEALAQRLVQGKGQTSAPRASIGEFQQVMNLMANAGRGMKKSSVKGDSGQRQRVADSGRSAAEARTPRSPAIEETAKAEVPADGEAVAEISPSIFRAYDIRGVVGETLTADAVYFIGRAVGSEAHARGEQTVIIARDGRDSSQALSDALGRGLIESGQDVVDLGMVPTPVLYFATHFLGSSSGVMVTGSHNPPEYNGFKIVVAGETLAESRIQDLHRRIVEGDLSSGKGSRRDQDLIPDYIGRISEDVQLLAPVKLVVDCGNGVASVVAPALFRVLGCEVIDLYCEVDGTFPNHHPDPGDPRNMEALIAKVREEGADLGVAFDGDGDRLGVVDCEGKIIWPDRLLMLLARDVLLRQPGADVIYDVKSSRHLASEILMYGGRPIMWKSGHSLVKEKMNETGAVLAGELTGHIYFKERWYGFDDGLYSCARLLEVLTGEGLSTAEVFSQLPESHVTPALHMRTQEGRNFELIDALTEKGEFPGAKLVAIDGIRAEFQDGWGLIRASNTGPNLMFRFEADDENALARIQGIVKAQFASIDPTLELPF